MFARLRETGINVPLNYEYVLDASGSFDAERRNITTYEWDTDGDGVYDQYSPFPVTKIKFTELKTYVVGLRVSNDRGDQDFANCTVVVSADGDGVPDGLDNCPTKFNPWQEDTDADGLGNACDPTPYGGNVTFNNLSGNRRRSASVYGDPPGKAVFLGWNGHVAR